MISIIVPSYNRAHILPKTINSVLNQTFSNWELIIVDDGSIDDTKEVVLAFNDSRIRYIYQENKGVCAARNKGVSKANGVYLVFLDSDDYVTTNWLHDFNEIGSNHNVDFVFCNMKMIDLRSKAEKIVKASDPYNQGIYSDDGLYMPGTFCVKYSFFELIGGFDEKIKFGEFTEFRLRTLNIKRTKFFTQKLGLIYIASLEGGSKNLMNKIESNLYVLEKHKAFFEKNTNDKKNYLNSAAVAAIRLGDYKLGHKLFRQSFHLKKNIKSLFQFIFSSNKFIATIIWKNN